MGANVITHQNGATDEGCTPVERRRHNCCLAVQGLKIAIDKGLNIITIAHCVDARRVVRLPGISATTFSHWPVGGQ